jgi:hypothetical protein
VWGKPCRCAGRVPAALTQLTSLLAMYVYMYVGEALPLRRKSASSTDLPFGHTAQAVCAAQPAWQRAASPTVVAAVHANGTVLAQAQSAAWEQQCSSSSCVVVEARAVSVRRESGSSFDHSCAALLFWQDLRDSGCAPKTIRWGVELVANVSSKPSLSKSQQATCC